MAYIGQAPANKAVVASDLDPAVITGQTALAVAPADTDEFLISDAGVLKRLDASLIGGGGKVLQLVTATSNTSLVSTASSWVDLTGVTLSITPAATSSKIWVVASCPLFSNGGVPVLMNIVRGSTGLGQATTGFGKIDKQDSASWELHTLSTINYLDSPSTTSATTYKIQIYTANGGTHGTNTPTSVITAIEIGA